MSSGDLVASLKNGTKKSAKAHALAKKIRKELRRRECGFGGQHGISSDEEFELI